MKKIMTLAAAMLLCISAFAQQALFGEAQLKSPEINPDNTVTFRFNAPKAIMVQLTGDFLPSVKRETQFGTFDAQGVVDLKQNDKGVWEYTSDVLAPELYMYSFVVDGLPVRDPANVFEIRDVNSVTNYFLITKEKGDKGSLYSVNEVPHGTVSRVWYDSPTLGMKRRMTVYTPSGYEDNSKQKYPVMYLLHGMGGDEEAWINLGRTSQILDNLIASGAARPMIVVMPNGNVDEEAAAGEKAGGFAQPSMMHEGMMDGKFEQSFPDIIKYVESHYRVMAKKSSRAICGLSMGGFHSMHISCYYPDLFDYVGLFSAAIMPNTNPGAELSPVYKDIDNQVKVQFSKNPKLYWIGIGSADFLINANDEYRAKLDSAGFKYTYYPTGKGHIWENWRIYLSQFAPLCFK
jgi:enterochelin esterase family protein